MLSAIINLKDYTAAEHIFFAIGCLLWVFTYILVIKSIRNKQFVEVPIRAVCANFAWEFLWSWVFVTDMGSLYIWGYRIWFFLDCFIVWGLFRYGAKQIDIPQLAKKFHLWLIFALASWGTMLYFFIKEYDVSITHMGAISGYILNVMMSAMYITLYLRMKDKSGFSYTSAWLKGVGTLLISVFCFLHFGNNGWLLSMCLVTAVLDFVYIGWFKKWAK